MTVITKKIIYHIFRLLRHCIFAWIDIYTCTYALDVCINIAVPFVIWGNIILIHFNKQQGYDWLNCHQSYLCSVEIYILHSSCNSLNFKQGRMHHTPGSGPIPQGLISAVMYACVFGMGLFQLSESQGVLWLILLITMFDSSANFTAGLHYI